MDFLMWERMLNSRWRNLSQNLLGLCNDTQFENRFQDRATRRALLLCASFQIHRWIQTGVTVRKHSIWVKIRDFFVLRDLQIWWMALKNNRAPLLYYGTLSFASHFGTIGKFKLELGNERRRYNMTSSLNSLAGRGTEWSLTSIKVTFQQHFVHKETYHLIIIKSSEHRYQ